MGLTLVFLAVLIGGMFCSFAGIFCDHWTGFRRLLTGVGFCCGLISMGILYKVDLLFVHFTGFPPWCDLSYVSVAMMIVFPLDIIITRRRY
ncbi:MAG: hypothetical protein ABH835_01905 [Patescibacteria group bacterium]|nr:hypothetical protein [Patescibacteria group bacterium]